MKTTSATPPDQGDDWRPSTHMPRVLTTARNVQTGDRVRVQDHRKKLVGEGAPSWHTVTVTDLKADHSGVQMMTNKWPIAYVCVPDELVELVDIKRCVSFRCVMCDRQDATEVTVTLMDFVNPQLLRSGGLHVQTLRDLDPEEQVGYCAEHGTDLLS